MAYTTIKKPSDYFNTKLYTGNGVDNTSITGVGFQPDFTWIKSRTNTDYPMIADAVRGDNKQLKTYNSDAQDSDTNKVKSFNSDGFTIGTGTVVNRSGATFVSWNLKANGAGSSDTEGSINTTYTSVNTTAGFSIIKYTGNGTANATIGHGLGVEPAMILFKRTDSSNNWIVYQKTMGTGHYLTLNTTGAKDSASGAWCTPSSTLIQLNQVFGATNTNSATYIAYCFAEKQGYSKFGSYVATGNADSAFCYTGFAPAFVMIKRTDGGDSWVMIDSKRDTYNQTSKTLHADLSDAEVSRQSLDFLSNGFKIRAGNGLINGTGNNHIYMAFAEEPLVGDNPATAR